MGQRQIDMRAEQELAKFLDAHLYGELLKEGGFSSFRRISDPDEQKRGIDVVGTAPRAAARIDEKAQLHYINQNRPSFAVELSVLREGQPTTGWFLNEALLTTHYLLLWPNAATSDLAQIASGDFTQVEGMALSRRGLKDFLAGLGLGRDQLAQAAAQLRAQGAVGRQESGQDGIWYFVSPPELYPEHPVNLVIRKPLLARLALARYLVDQTGFARLPPEGET